MITTDIIRALQAIPPCDVIIGDGRILYAPYKDEPDRIYVLQVEESLNEDQLRIEKKLAEHPNYLETKAMKVSNEELLRIENAELSDHMQDLRDEIKQQETTICSLEETIRTNEKELEKFQKAMEKIAEIAGDTL